MDRSRSINLFRDEIMYDHEAEVDQKLIMH